VRKKTEKLGRAGQGRGTYVKIDIGTRENREGLICFVAK
jgi:hypothetical protein